MHSLVFIKGESTAESLLVVPQARFPDTWPVVVVVLLLFVLFTQQPLVLVPGTSCHQILVA